jgi:hypothetical protein
VDEAELNSRRRFIRDSRENLNAMKNHMQSRETRGKMEKDQRDVRNLIAHKRILSNSKDTVRAGRHAARADQLSTIKDREGD